MTIRRIVHIWVSFHQNRNDRVITTNTHLPISLPTVRSQPEINEDTEMTLSALRFRRFAISTVLVIAVVLSACTDRAGVDREALARLYQATDGANWRVNTNWLSDRPVREWYGVTIDRDRVVDLHLRPERFERRDPVGAG